MKKYIIPILGILAVSALVIFWAYEKRGEEAVTTGPTPERQQQCEEFLMVALFPDDGSADRFMEACLRGEPVLPGEMEEVPPPDEVGNNAGPYVGAGCAVGGCSSQICGEAGEVEDMVTTCEWRDEYACYASSRCERQANGQCGWTETEEFNQCMRERCLPRATIIRCL